MIFSMQLLMHDIMPISKSTVVRTIQRFIETGSVKDRSCYL